MLLFDLKRYAINDGPGVRITVFMKGCPLSCAWCHNPEGIGTQPERLYARNRCIGCGFCVSSCPYAALSLTSNGIAVDTGRCRQCGACAAVCPSKATEMSGTDYTIEEVMSEIEKECLVMDRSGGGVTFSGGEPLMHPKELLGLLQCCGDKGIHRTVDTTLFAAPEVLRMVTPHTDLFLVDLKVMDSAVHRRFTGVPNEQVLSNLQWLSGEGVPFWIRIPLIEGINADEGNIACTISFLQSLEGDRPPVYLLPYHDHGKGKHEKRGSSYNPRQFHMETPSEAVKARCAGMFREAGFEVRI